MEKIRNSIGKMIMLTTVAALFTLASCKDDDETPVFADPTITVTPSTASQLPGGKVTFSIAITAEAGAASVKLNDTEIKAYATETKADAFSYEYTVPAGATSGDLNFTVTDKQTTAKTATAKSTLTVGTPGKETVIVDAAITSNTTWSANKFYLLKGNIYVQASAELTIEPGTIVLGDKVTKGALIVSRGAKIHAKGTSAAPIIFTSSAPKGFRNYGDWGGVVILGNEANNQSVNQTIEGISAATGDNGKYGGTSTTDDSGEFYYVRIEFGGIALSTDNELNGLTLGSVGKESEIHHIQVSYSGDDSFEWFGGTVNHEYLVAYRGFDDDLDVDFGYSGNVQYAAVFRDPNFADKSGSNAFESDNDGSGSTNTPKTSAKFANVTWFGPHVYSKPRTGSSPGFAASIDKDAASDNYQFGGHIRRKTDIQIYNSAFVGSQLEGVHFDGTGSAAEFKGNYFGRTGISTSTAGTVKKETAPLNTAQLATFDADNFSTTSGATQTGAFDLSAVFAGMKYNQGTDNKWSNNLSIDTPGGLLASGSTLLTGAKTVPSGLTQKDYVGAFDATNNWMAGWTEFNPINKDYGN